MPFPPPSRKWWPTSAPVVPNCASRPSVPPSRWPVAGADQTLADADGHFRQRYGVRADGGAYLLRPDQHVCGRWVTLDAVRLQAALDTALPQ